MKKQKKIPIYVIASRSRKLERCSVFSRSSVRQLKSLMKWVCITEINVWLLSCVNCNFNEKNSRMSRWLFTSMIHYAYVSFPLKLGKSFQSKGKFKFSIFSRSKFKFKILTRSFRRRARRERFKITLIIA